MTKFIACALISTFVSAPAMTQNRVQQYDFDRDGKVSFEDINRYCTVSKNLFNHADKNGNGFLSEGEMRAARHYLFERCLDVPK